MVLSPEIVTDRLILSPLVAADAEAVLRYRSDADACRYQNWTPETLDDVRTFIAGLEGVEFDTPGTWFQFGIRRREAGTLVGDLGVHFLADQLRQVEVGITVSLECQRQGIASEALRAVIDRLLGPMEKHRVIASVDPRNVASVALLTRLGMRREAHFRRSLWFKGEWADDLVFAVLDSEWEHARTGSGEARA